MVRCFISGDFLCDFINGDSARLGAVFDTLPDTSVPIIPTLHLNFDNVPKDSARHLANDTRKAGYSAYEVRTFHVPGSAFCRLSAGQRS
jgi:hypothetical protein